MDKTKAGTKAMGNKMGDTDKDMETEYDKDQRKTLNQKKKKINHIKLN